MTALFLYQTPFDDGKPFHGLPGGRTVAELLDMVRAPDGVYSMGQVSVGGVPVPRDWWGRVRVKADAWLSVRVVPRGGGGGGGAKSTISTIATIALLVGATAITAGAFGPAGLGIAGGLFAAGSTSAYLLAAGVSIVGQLALSALAPPPVAPNLGGGGGIAGRDIAGVTGNPLGRRDYLPAVLGTMRASPPHVMWPYTELVNGEVVANAMFGLAGRCIVEDIQLAGAPIEDFDGVEYQVSNDDSLISLFGYGSGKEQQVGQQLSEWQLQTEAGKTDWTINQDTPESSYPNWMTFKTAGVCDRADIRFLFPSGILSQNTNAGALMMALQFRRAGETSWINGPEFWWSDKNAKPGQKRQHIRLLWREAPAGLGATSADAWAWAAYGATPQAWQWKPAGYFAPASGFLSNAVNVTDDGFDVYLDPAVFPKGQYEVRLRRGLQVNRSTWTVASYAWSGGTARWYDTISTAAPWRAASSQDTQTGPVVVEVFTTRSDDYPFTQDNQTLLAVRTTGVSIDQVSALFTSIAPDWNGTAWIEAPTRNPAALFREVLLGDLNTKKQQPSQLNEARLIEWHDFCVARGFECNAVVQGLTVKPVLQLIAAAGHALPQQADKWGVVIEQDTSGQSPRQIFSHRTSRALVIEKSFADLPHAIVAEYIDEANDYKLAETIVYLPGWNALTATEFETIRYDGITNVAKVRERARLDAGQLVYRQQRYRFEESISHLAVTRGDLVGLAFDTLGSMHDSARIVEVLTDGSGDITGFVLDSVVEIVPGPPPFFEIDDFFAVTDLFGGSAASGVVVQCRNGTTMTLPITETSNTDTLTLAEPVADTGIVKPGLGVAVGRLHRETRRCKVFSMERVADHQARPTLVDEAPEIHAA